MLHLMLRGKFEMMLLRALVLRDRPGGRGMVEIGQRVGRG